MSIRKLQTRCCGGSVWSHRCRLRRKKQGIKAVMWIWIAPWLLGIIRIGTPEMRQWLHDLRDGDSGYRGVIIASGSSALLEEIYWLWKANKPFTFKDWSGPQSVSHYEKNEVVMVGDQLMTDIRAAHQTVFVRFGQPLVEHDFPSRRRLAGRVNAVSWPNMVRLYTKRI